MNQLAACHCCGLVQRVPPLAPARRALCRRCRTPLRQQRPGRNRWAASLALCALMFYPAALSLPMLRIERLGHRHEDSLLTGLGALLAEGYWLVGGVVLLFSVVLPLLKLLSLLVLANPGLVAAHHHRALLYRGVEGLGRWGMLDVMLVALLVAYVKLGNLVSISAGPGLLAFTLLVLCSLLAGLLFNPHALWAETESA